MLADLLWDLLRAIDPGRVVHPIHMLQERPLAYELYHRLREFEGGNNGGFGPALPQGELNKTGANYFAHFFASIHKVEIDGLDFTVHEAMPDLLIHDPWSNDHNLLVAEIKRAQGPWRAIAWDLAKLALFGAGELSYHERVFILALNPGQRFGFWRSKLEKLVSGDGPGIQVLFADIQGQRFDRFALQHSVEAAEAYLRTPPSEVHADEGGGDDEAEDAN